MKPATISPELEAALARFEQGGGVVHYFVFEADTDPDLHHRATLEGFQLLRAQRGPFRLTLIPELMKATNVNLEAFLGVMETEDGALTSPRAYLRAKIQALSSSGNFVMPITDGYLRAFCEPPYSLRLSPEEAQGIFETINDLLLGGLTDVLEIKRWSDDWSNFFEAGLEWWGAFWWTIHNRTRNLVVVIAASTTD